MLVNNKIYEFSDFTYEIHPYTNTIEVITNKNTFNFYGSETSIDELSMELMYATANTTIEKSNYLKCFIQGNKQ